MSMYRDRTMVWVLAATLASTSLGAQMAANNADSHVAHKAEAKLPVQTLDLTRLEPIPGMPAATVMSFPELCSSDGDIFSLVYATAASGQIATFPDVYGVSPQREVKHLTIPFPQNFKFTSVESFFPGKFSLVYLIQATGPQGAAGDVDSARIQFFLAKTDRDGGSPEVTKLALPFEPEKLAVFDNGDLLSVGADTANLHPVLALLHEDGSLNRILNFDDRAYQDAILSGGGYVAHPNDSNTAAQQRLILGSLARTQLVPWGSEVLLVQPGSTSPVFRVGSTGMITPVKVSAPTGYLLQTIEGSGSHDTWLAWMRDVGSFVRLNSGKVVGASPEQMLEIDPHTGKAVRALDVKGPHLGEVSCGADHKASAIYYDPVSTKDSPSQLMYASAPR
jgi:hypothetical protein